MKELDATPTKRIYQSIIRDYDLKTAIAELVDNAIDAWAENKKTAPLKIDVRIDLDQQSISIQDNAGGVKENELAMLISPGASSTDGTSNIIGIFGVGSKRAVVVLAEDIKITSRHQRQKTFRIRYDEEWIQDPDNWRVEYRESKPIDPNHTLVELSNLRMKITNDDLLQLKEFLGVTYAKILDKNEVEIILNGQKIHGIGFENWSFNPQYRPTRFHRKLKLFSPHTSMSVRITGGLVRERGHEHGVYVYCNDRLICRALRGVEVGFKEGRTGHHVNYSLARIIVELKGPSECMPWTSNKGSLNYNHQIFEAIKDDIIRTSERYRKISYRLFEAFDSVIKPYAVGTVRKVDALSEGEPLKRSRLPAIPPAKKDYKRQIIALNAKLVKEKPWTRGLYEAIIVEEMVSRQSILKQGRRISLMILDSTLEIGLKDYLAFEIGLGDTKLAEIFSNRHQVHAKAKEHLDLPSHTWKNLEYFYKLRCDLTHRKVSAEISDETLEHFRSLVKEVLGEAVGLKFPSLG